MPLQLLDALEGLVHDKGGTVFNPLAYGISTANADNTAALNTLASAINVTGGGIIRFPAHSTTTPFKFLGQVFCNYDNVSIEGAGSGLTLLSWPTGCATRTSAGRVGDFPALTMGLTSRACRLRGLTLKGPAAATRLGYTVADIDGVQVQSRLELHDVTVNNFDANYVLNSYSGGGKIEFINCASGGGFVDVYGQQTGDDCGWVLGNFGSSGFANFYIDQFSDTGWVNCAWYRTHCGFAPFSFYSAPGTIARFMRGVQMHILKPEKYGNAAFYADAGIAGDGTGITVSTTGITSSGTPWAGMTLAGNRIRLGSGRAWGIIASNTDSAIVLDGNGWRSNAAYATLIAGGLTGVCWDIGGGSAAGANAFTSFADSRIPTTRVISGTTDGVSNPWVQGLVVSDTSKKWIPGSIYVTNGIITVTTPSTGDTYTASLTNTNTATSLTVAANSWVRTVVGTGGATPATGPCSYTITYPNVGGEADGLDIRLPQPSSNSGYALPAAFLSADYDVKLGKVNGNNEFFMGDGYFTGEKFYIEQLLGNVEYWSGHSTSPTLTLGSGASTGWHVHSGVAVAAVAAATYAAPTVALGTAAAAGAATTGIRSDATIAAFDATNPASSAPGDTVTVGTASVASRRDHKHAREPWGLSTDYLDQGTAAAGASGHTADAAHVHPVHTATSDPTVNNDNTAGYGPGSTWINTSTAVMYRCLSSATGAAKWQRMTADVQTFTSGGTWTKPAWATVVTIACVGSGGGGGSGAQTAAGTAGSGGGGGGGGAYGFRTLPAAVCGATEAVTVGAAGGGGAAQATTSTAGNAGTSGGNSKFGAHVNANGGGAGGGGGLGAAGTAGTGGTGEFPGGAGAAGSATGAVGTGASNSSGGAPGGGSGGGVTTAAAASAGGGGSLPAGTLTGAAAAGGTSAGGAGAAGASVTANEPNVGGSGGGGGSGVAATAGGTGGAGGGYGAGGGGGGGAANGASSGAGGSGAAGIVVVIST